MAKVVDITDKLNFDENPKLCVCGQQLEVNADAETLLRVMGAFSNQNQMQATSEALNLLFGKEELEKLYAIEKDGKKLSAKALMTIIEAAMDLVMGENEGE